MAFDEEYFSTSYGNYELQNPERKHAAYLRLLLGPSKHGGRLLDIGCSYGLFVRRASEYFEAAGADVDPGVVAQAKRNVPGAEFVVGVLPSVPIGDNDVITVLDVLEHVEDLASTMRSLGDALRPGGVLLVVVPVYDGPLGWLVRLLDNDPTHIHKQSRRFWLELARRDFELLEWTGSFRKLVFGRWYLHAMSRPLRAISPALVMMVRKPPREA